MDARQRSQQLGFDDPSQQHEREEDKTQWPGKRSLTQTLSSSSGGVLPTGLQKNLEGKMGGEDLSNVRVHVDSQAAQAAQGLNARAFTVGQAVYFGAGQYDPSSQGGQRLIAHEVAHTVQQRGAAGSPQLDSLDVSTPGDAHETEAESFAQTFVGGGKGTKITPVSKGVVARAVIQRDLLNGDTPPALDHQPQPVHPKEPSPSELTSKAQDSIRRERGQGGTEAVVRTVKQMRSQATPKTKGPIENAISSELNDEEKGALEGKKPDASKKANANSGQGGDKADPKSPKPADKPANKTADKKGPEEGQETKETAKGDYKGGEGEGGDHKEGKEGEGGEGGAHKKEKGKEGKEGGEHAGGEHAGGEHGGAHEGTEHGGTHHGAEGGDHAAAAHETAGHVPEAEGKELIEQELAFHDRWKVYSQSGAGGRAAHLARTLFYGDGPGGTGSRLMGGDLTQGMISAVKGQAVGLGVQMLATRTPLSKIPGVGNILGGALSAYTLFSHGGAGIKQLGSHAMHGIGGAFSAQNWKDSPWLTAANLFEGIKAVLEIVGHVCNILSGLAYAFAAIAAIGGLLSWLFPPLAFLVPYIPVAINFGRACSGIATVALAVAGLLSPIVPILKAVHLIVSNDDPVKLAAEEDKYHETAQYAIATYGNSKISQKIEQHGIKPLGIKGTGEPGKGFVRGQLHHVEHGMETYRSTMDGHLTPGMKGQNFRASTENTKEALGIGKDPVQSSRNYFDAHSQKPVIDQRMKKEERQLRREEGKLGTAERNHAKAEAHADAQQAKLDEKGTQQAFRNSVRASDAAEAKGVKVEQQRGAVAHQEHRVERVEWQKDINHPHEVGGEAADGTILERALRREREEKAEQAHGSEIAREVNGEGGEHGGEHGGGEHGGEHVEVERDDKGHVQLPEPPGNLDEIEQLDHTVEELEHEKQEIAAKATEAKKLQAETSQQAAGLKTASAGVKGHVKGEQQRSQQKQQHIQTQNTEITSKTGQAHGKGGGGIQQAANPLRGIASAAHTVDGLLQRIPSNRFFDVSGAKNSVHQFVVGMDQVFGAGSQQQQAQGQATAAVGQRTGKVTEAAGKNQAASNQGNKLAADMQSDAEIAHGASTKAGDIAQEGKSQAAQTEAQIAQLKSQRQAKWQALLQWAAKHRQIRDSVNQEHH